MEVFFLVLHDEMTSTEKNSANMPLKRFNVAIIYLIYNACGHCFIVCGVGMSLLLCVQLHR